MARDGIQTRHPRRQGVGVPGVRGRTSLTRTANPGRHVLGRRNTQDGAWPLLPNSLLLRQQMRSTCAVHIPFAMVGGAYRLRLQHLQVVLQGTYPGGVSCLDHRQDFPFLCRRSPCTRRRCFASLLSAYRTSLTGRQHRELRFGRPSKATSPLADGTGSTGALNRTLAIIRRGRVSARASKKRAQH